MKRIYAMMLFTECLFYKGQWMIFIGTFEILWAIFMRPYLILAILTLLVFTTYVWLYIPYLG